MVTRVTRDVLDLGRGVNTGIDVGLDASASFKVVGNSSVQFRMDGVVIGDSDPTAGTFDDMTVTGTLDATGATIVGLGVVPVGGVIMFNAAFATIPVNYQLCDGTNGTPDMTNQFVYGTNTEGQLLDSGGQADAIIPNHTHSVNDPGHRHSIRSGVNGNGSGGHDDSSVSFNTNTTTSTTGITIDTATGGEGVNNKNLPPYIKLAFIQRMS